MVRVRFAPVPSGNLHLGGARIALANWLFARKHDGRFVVRVEDTDRRISFPEYEKSILQALRWLGLDWDESPSKDGPFSPYRQSERHDLYQDQARRLIEGGHAYFCFCSRKELLGRLKRGTATPGGEGVRYDGHCRGLSALEVKAGIRRGLRPAVRFSVAPRTVRVHDLVKGKVAFDAGLLGDFLILRGDGTALYNFACSVDDFLMEITHVLRGEDHLPNLPKQILILEALGAPIPEYGHLPLLMDRKGRKLSKRTYAQSIFLMKQQGIRPEAIVNYLFGALAPTADSAVRGLECMKSLFELEKVPSSSSRHSPERLRYVNKAVLRCADPDELAEETRRFAETKGIRISRDQETQGLLRNLVRENASRAGDLADLTASSVLPLRKGALSRDGRIYLLDRFPPRHLVKYRNQLSSTTLEELRDSPSGTRSALFPLFRLAVLGNPDGMPVETLLSIFPWHAICAGIRQLPDPAAQPPRSSGEKLEREKIRAYFEARLGIRAEKIVRLRGFRNKGFRILAGGEDWVVKRSLCDDLSSLWREKEALQALSGTDLAPREPSLDLSQEFFREPVLMYRWLPGHPLSSFRSASLPTLARALRTLHEKSASNLPRSEISSLSAYFLSLARMMQEYLVWRKGQGMADDPLCSGMAEALAALPPIVSKRSEAWHEPPPLVMTHGDLHASNVLERSGKYGFVDWEEASLSDPALELEWMFRINSFTEIRREEFLSCYLKEPSRCDRTFRDRLEGYGLVNDLLWPVTRLHFLTELLDGKRKVAAPLQSYVKGETKRLLPSLKKSLKSLTRTTAVKTLPLYPAWEGALLPEPLKTGRRIQVTLDGVAGAAKSLIAAEAARKARLLYVNGGSLFRALALYLHKVGHAPDKLTDAVLRDIRLRYLPEDYYPYFALYVNGRNVTPTLFSSLAENLAPLYSREPHVLSFVKAKIRGLEREAVNGIVLEGRKAGLEMLPEAGLKVFVTGDFPERAERKYRQLAELGEKVTREQVAELIAWRDRADYGDLISPWKQDPAYLVLDSTGKAPEDLASMILAKLRAAI